MRRSRLVAAAAVVVGVAGFTAAATVAGDHKRDFKTDRTGYEDVPAVSTAGNGQVDVEVARDGQSFRFVLHYRALESPVTQSHIHFGQKGVAAGVSIFLCTNLGNGPAGTPACPSPGGTVTRTVTAADVVGPAGQGIAPGEWAEVIAAIRAGVTYANVHTAQYGPGEIRGQISTGDDQGDQD
jgi:CHRD domain-containing protein